MSLMTNTSKFKTKQWIAICLIIVMTAIIAFFMLKPSSKPSASVEGEHAEHAEGEAHTEDKEKKADPVSETEASHGNEEASKEVVVLSAEQMSEAKIKVAVAKNQSIASSQTLAGTLQLDTDAQAHVSTPFTGSIQQVYVSTGERVTRGQALAVLQSPELIEMQSQVSITKSNADLARTTLERERKLWNQGISAKQDYLQAENDYQKAMIEVKTSEQKLNAFGATGNSSGRITIKSPISGVITNKDLSLGETVRPDSELFTISNLTALWVEFAVPSQLSAGIAPNTPVKIQTPDGKLLSAKVLTFTPTADGQTKQLLARASIINTNERLRPNMLVNILVDSGSTTSQLAVQSSAIQTFENKKVVFVAISKEGKTEFKPQPVELGASKNADWVSIVSGLTEGIAYVSEGSFALKSELEKGEAEHDD